MWCHFPIEFLAAHRQEMNRNSWNGWPNCTDNCYINQVKTFIRHLVFTKIALQNTVFSFTGLHSHTNPYTFCINNRFCINFVYIMFVNYLSVTFPSNNTSVKSVSGFLTRITTYTFLLLYESAYLCIDTTVYLHVFKSLYISAWLHVANWVFSVGTILFCCTGSQKYSAPLPPKPFAMITLFQNASYMVCHCTLCCRGVQCSTYINIFVFYCLVCV